MSMTCKKCCVPGCMDSGNSHRTLHLFPNPEKDKERFNIWILSIGGDIIGLDYEYIYIHRRVCHAHFEEKFCCRYNRISNIAVPTLNLPGPLSIPKFVERRPMRQIQDSLTLIPSTSTGISSLICSNFKLLEQSRAAADGESSECSRRLGRPRDFSSFSSDTMYYNNDHKVSNHMTMKLLAASLPSAAISVNMSCGKSFEYGIIKKELEVEADGSEDPDGADEAEVVIVPEFNHNNYQIKLELYDDHQIKDELVIGPEVLHHPVPPEAQVSNEAARLQSSPQYCCEPCNQYFDTASSLALHNTAHHKSHSHDLSENYPKLTCGTCDKEHTPEHCPRNHVNTRLTSRGDASEQQGTMLICDISKKQYNRKSSLASHLRTHSNDKQINLSNL